MKKITKKKANNRIESAFALSIVGLFFLSPILEPIAAYLAYKYYPFCSERTSVKAEVAKILSVVGIIKSIFAIIFLVASM